MRGLTAAGLSLSCHPALSGKQCSWLSTPRDRHRGSVHMRMSVPMPLGWASWGWWSGVGWPRVQRGRQHPICVVAWQPLSGLGLSGLARSVKRSLGRYFIPRAQGNWAHRDRGEPSALGTHATASGPSTAPRICCSAHLITRQTAPGRARSARSKRLLFLPFHLPIFPGC